MIYWNYQNYIIIIILQHKYFTCNTEEGDVRGVM